MWEKSARRPYLRVRRVFPRVRTFPTFPHIPIAPKLHLPDAQLRACSAVAGKLLEAATTSTGHSAKAWALGVAVAAVASRTNFSRAVGMAPAHEPRRGRTRPLSDESLPFERAE